jgi:hypothetical protein
VREVARELGEKVVIKEHPAQNREEMCESQISRGIVINGKEIGWGWAAPKDEIMKAILEEIEKI